ncbi:hypothetical protein O9G_005858, partial [Rozella allomycis CSF55]
MKRLCRVAKYFYPSDKLKDFEKVSKALDKENLKIVFDAVTRCTHGSESTKILVSVPNRMVEEVTNDISDMDNIFNNEEKVDIILKVLNMYNGIVKSSYIDYKPTHLIDLFTHLKKFETNLGEKNVKVEEMKNEFRNFFISLTKYHSGETFFIDVYPIVKVIFNDGEDVKFSEDFFEWIKYYSQQVEKLETINDEEMFKLKIAWYIVNNYGDVLWNAKEFGPNGFLLKEYYEQANVLFEVVVRTRSEASIEFIEYLKLLNEHCSYFIKHLSLLSKNFDSEVLNGLKEIKKKTLKFIFTAIESPSNDLVIGKIRKLVFSDIDDMIDLTDEIIDLFFALLERDLLQRDKYAWQYFNKMKNIVNRNFERLSVKDELRLGFSNACSVLVSPIDYPNDLKITTFKIVSLLKFRSRNVSNPGLEASNKILEAFSEHNFHIKVGEIVDEFYQDLTSMLNHLLSFATEAKKNSNNNVLLVKLDFNQYSQMIFNLFKFALKLKSDETSASNLKEMATKNILLKFPSLEKNKLQDIVNGLVNIEQGSKSFKRNLKLFLNPEEEQSEIDDDGDDDDEHESSAQTRHVGFVEKSKPEDENRNVSKGSTIKGKIMAGATVGLAALASFLFKNNPATQDVSAVVASGHSDASLVALPQGLPSGNFDTNINAFPAVKLPHDPLNASLQTKDRQIHRLANSGSDEKGVEDRKNVAGQGTGVTVDKKKQYDTTPTSNNNSSVPTD